MSQVDFDAGSSPEELQELFDKLEQGEEIATQPAEKPAATEPAATDTAATGKAEGESQTAAGDEDAAGVATRDGKHIIPYTVLTSERTARQQAEQMANSLKERVAYLESLVQNGSQGANTGESARTEQPDAVSDVDLEALREDFPTVYKAVKASLDRAAQLEAKLKPVEETVRTAQADQERTAQQTVQEAIDAVPKLAQMQASEPELFALAKQFDATLRNQAAWKDRPMAERFAKVAEMVESATGTEIKTPNNASAQTQDLKAAAAAKLAAKGKGTGGAPNSLSDFPAGQPAAIDAAEAAEHMTHGQLAEKLSRMTPEQQDAYFANL